ncbi:transposase domain-containing protein, partial [Pseudogemmobacter sp. W21_MBD1_M6]|uniref:transposase domain-containing protein n=1 Tax=Pseudogemmobacter sp. W21_MBD1_M6 TaxID=3240271 RepID=UPI003F976F0A
SQVAGYPGTGGRMLSEWMAGSSGIRSLDPQAYLTDILARIHDHKINRLDELLPWNWSPLAAPNAEAA